MFKENIEKITNKFSLGRKAKINEELDLEILYLSRKIGNIDNGTQEYDQAIDELKKLVEIRNASKDASKINSADILKFVGAGLTAGTSILGIMMVLKYENSDEIITSKSFSLATKLLGK